MFVRRKSVPIDEDEIHCELVRKEDIHEKQRREMKDYSHTENPPANASPEDRERKEKLPDQDEANRKRQVLLDLR